MADRRHPFICGAACVLLTGAVLIACSGSGGQATAARAPARTATSRPLTGKTVGVDPGHNGRNYTDPTYIDHQI